MGTKNNQETTWTDKLDAENIDPYRPGMEGCFACPVNCRPLNDHDGCEHVRQDQIRARATGPSTSPSASSDPTSASPKSTQVLRLNNICNDLGLDTASTGSAIAWAMELYQRGSSRRNRRGLDLTWGNYETIERLLFMMAKREGFGNVIADSSRAVENGQYPAGGARLPDGGEGADAERSARRPHPQSVRARPGRRHARHGPPAQPRHARDQRQDQRRSRVQSASCTAARSARSRTATKARRSPSAAARTSTRSAIRSACAASRRSSSTHRRCRATRSSPTRSRTSPASS